MGLLQLSVILFVLCCGIRGGEDRPHISNLNLLLPPRTLHPVRYRLQGSDGCFTWTWDHHDIISVDAEYNSTATKCSTSAVITPIAPYNGRKSTAVHAKDTITGQVLRCEVFVDQISRIQIFHHSVKLDLDALAPLRIRAFDSEDNIFSTIVGLQFMWELSPLSPREQVVPNRLAHVSLRDTPLSDYGPVYGEIETQIKIEETGYASDLYVVRGINAGQEVVTAKLVEPYLKELEDSIIITVAEAMSLEPPSPLYIIPGTHLQYTLKTLRQNIPVAVQLPSRYHQWFVTNASVALIDQHKGLLFANELGATSVLVEDIRVKGHHQISTVHVVIPSNLRLVLSPLSSLGRRPNIPLDIDTSIVSSSTPWHIVVGREYVVEVLAFSAESGGRPLYLTQENNLKLAFGGLPYWDVIPIPEDVSYEHGWHNGTILHALLEGNGTLVATLVFGDFQNETSMGKDDGVLKVKQDVIICSRVHILLEGADEEQREIRLPWIPEHSQEYKLKVRGGCGEKARDYHWFSSLSSVANVDALGFVHSKGPGRTVISVSAISDSLNTDQITVEVTVPSSIIPVPEMPVEFEIKSHLLVAVSMVNPSGLRYSRCDKFNLPVKWSIHDTGFMLVDIRDTNQFDAGQVPSDRACAWTVVSALHPGRTTVVATLEIGEPISGQSIGLLDGHRSLKVSWTIASYSPLAVLQAGDGNSYGGYACSTPSCRKEVKDLVLVVGSSMKIILQGGPDRWRQGIKFMESHEVIPEDIDNSIGDLSVGPAEEAGRIYLVTCCALGNYTLVFHRGNLEGEDHPLRSVASSAVNVLCWIPASITLVVEEAENSYSYIKAVSELERDHNRVRLSPITVVNSRSIRVAAVAMYKYGIPFANASSLFVNWHLERCNGLAEWEDSDGDKFGLWERKLALQNTPGLCTLRASVAYLKSSKQLSSITVTKTNNLLRQMVDTITDAALLQLVTALRLEPNEFLLFNHPDAKAKFSVIGGTRDIEASVNNSKVAMVYQQQPGAHVSHILVGARGLGSTMLIVRDMGLASPATAHALVQVADVTWIRLLLPDDLQVPLGSEAAVEVQAGDSTGHAFDQSQLAFMNLELHVQDEVVVAIRNYTFMEDGLHESAFRIRGTNIGLTSIQVSAQQSSGHHIFSDPGRVTVHAPLVFTSEKVLLAPGAKYVMVTQGGPTTGATLQFSSSDSSVATMDVNSGTVTAKSPGKSLLFAKAYSHAGVLMSEAMAELEVRMPLSMTLDVGGGQLGVGREMSVFPVGTDLEDLLSFFELCSNYKWAVSDEQVIGIRFVEPLKLEEHNKTMKVAEKNSLLDSSTQIVDAGFSARVNGRSPGKATISLTFSCHFLLESGQSAPMHYTATESISVVRDPPLLLASWVLPTEYTSSRLLPQASEDSFDGLLLKPDILYSVMHDSSSDPGGISIKDGHIQTKERTGVSCLQSKDRATGRYEVAACIRVAEVAQMTAGDDDYPFHVAEVSIGTQEHFTITLRDKWGIPFYEVGHGNVPLQIDTNQADVVSLKVTEKKHHGSPSNLLLTVQGVRQGVALIRISHKTRRHAVDYIMVIVGAYINPRNPTLHIGGHLTFSILGKGLLSGENGKWSTGDEEIIRINAQTGDALALAEGTTIVSFKGPRLTTYTPVSVVGVSVIKVQPPPRINLLTNAPPPDQGYNFPVHFGDSRGRNIGVVGEDVVSYDCSVDPSFIGRATAWRSPNTGEFYCSFFPYPPGKLVFTLQRELESKHHVADVGEKEGVLTIRIIATISGLSNVSGYAEAKFAGGFAVDSPHELHLSSRTNKSYITVVGSIGGLEVSWARDDALSINCVSQAVEFGVGGHAIYEVKMIGDQESFSDIVIFSLPTTGQRVEIPVKCEANLFYLGTSVANAFKAIVVTLIVIIIPLLICSRILDHARRFRSKRGVPSEQQGVVLNGNIDVHTPLHTPLQYRGSLTPPHPYTDYIGRTIEKTPYYSRQTYRRPDPSRTY